jgi:hypothetical protein
MGEPDVFFVVTHAQPNSLAGTSLGSLSRGDLCNLGVPVF